eukprot:755958-Hanusia_phi.AAC.1
MDDLSAQKVSGNFLLLKRIRTRHFRRLKASFAYCGSRFGMPRPESPGPSVGLSGRAIMGQSQSHGWGWSWRGRRDASPPNAASPAVFCGAC